MKKNKKYIIFLLIIITIVTLIIVFTQGKYVLEKNTNHVQNSEQFYFESDLLEIEEKIVQYTFSEEQKNNYIINFNIKNFQDTMRYNNFDATYSESFDTLYKIDVEILEQTLNGTASNENVSSIVKINNSDIDNSTLKNGNPQTDKISVILDFKNIDYAKIQITAEATSPYSKKLTKILEIKKEKKYEVELLDMGEYTRLLIKTNSYNGKLNISFDTTKLILEEIYKNIDTNTNTITDIIQTDENSKAYKILEVTENSNYQIDFIKKSNANITLGTDIEVTEEQN